MIWKIKKKKETYYKTQSNEPQLPATEEQLLLEWPSCQEPFKKLVQQLVGMQTWTATLENNVEGATKLLIQSDSCRGDMLLPSSERLPKNHSVNMSVFVLMSVPKYTFTFTLLTLSKIALYTDINFMLTLI